MVSQGRAAILAIACVSCLSPCLSAQVVAPGPYGPYGGWGGWGGGAATAPGDAARGLGVFAAGAGAYNRDTAAANAINADTIMRFNEYIWESQQLRNKRYYEQLAAQKDQKQQNVDAVYKRLHDAPEARDIASGAALNVVLDELTEPGLYLRSVRSANGEVSSKLVRSIPFQHATQAITISLNDLLRGDAPPIFDEPAYKPDRDALLAAADQANNELDKDGKIQPQTLDEIRSRVDALYDRFDANVKAGTPDRREGENYLKGIYGLTRLLESPQLDRYLGELDGRESTTLGNLISFMNAFNLRFGVAEKPAEVDAYEQLYPRLVDIRNQVYPERKPTAEAAESASTSKARRGRQATEVFSGLNREPFRPRTPKTAQDQPAVNAPDSPRANQEQPAVDPDSPRAPRDQPAVDPVTPRAPRDAPAPPQQ